jgi:hypothetical protein
MWHQGEQMVDDVRANVSITQTKTQNRGTYKNASLALLAEGSKGREGSTDRILEVVVGHLGEQVVDDMRANVVVDVIKDAVVPVNGGQASPHVVPLLQPPATFFQSWRLEM